MFGHGDGTVPLASLGYLCAGPWRQRNHPLNPSNIPIVIREYNQTSKDGGEEEDGSSGRNRRRKQSRWHERVYTSAAVGGTEGALLALVDEVEGLLIGVYSNALYLFALALSFVPRIPEQLVNFMRGASTTSPGHVEILGHRQFIIDLLLIASEGESAVNSVAGAAGRTVDGEDAEACCTHLGSSCCPPPPPPEADVMQDMLLTNVLELSTEIAEGIRGR